MKRLVFAVAALLVTLAPHLAAAAGGSDPARIDIYVTPYFDSNGPSVRVGTFSAGLESNDERRFVETAVTMQKQWAHLTFRELYVTAIRLYDFGYRNEAAYWFYSAQYRGRLFSLLIDQDKMGSIGSPGFELYNANNSFFQLAGPWINGYAFGHPDVLAKIVERVQRENRRSVPDVRKIYPGIAFINESRWQDTNAQLNAGMDQLVTMLTTQRAELAQRRAQNGTDKRYGSLTSKSFPGGY